jgi:hypothetical protein
MASIQGCQELRQLVAASGDVVYLLLDLRIVVIKP